MRAKTLFLLLFLGTSCAVAEEVIPRFDRRTDFAYLHPELIADKDFQAWDRSHVFGRWRELKRTPAGRQVVIVQEEDSEEERKGHQLRDIENEPIFAAEIQYLGITGVVLRTFPFSSSDVSMAFQDAERNLPKNELPITIAQPVVTFDHGPVLSWDLQKLVMPPPPSVLPYHDCLVPQDDSFSTDDLHHPMDAVLLKAAKKAVNGLCDVHAIARELCFEVTVNVEYNSNNLSNFYTDSDLLVATRGGECDEKAVILTTYLRAVGIHARMKFLRWTRNKKEEQHACVEYIVDGVAYHLDPTRGQILRPETYRCDPVEGVYPENVLVVDVDWPADARSTSDVDGQDDTDSSDGRLNPWGDFCYGPDKKGDKRARYSYDAASTPLPPAQPCPPPV